MIIDACYSAGLFESVTKEQIGISPTQIARHTIHPRAVVITSCRSGQTSKGKKNRYSPLFPRFFRRNRCTFFVESLLKVVKKRRRRGTTNKRLVRRIARLLEKEFEYDRHNQQRPALFCSDSQAQLNFLAPVA
jgi:hypothetical protein